MKTKAIITGNVHQSDLNGGDTGYIDGYVRGGDDRPCAVFVRDDDGLVDMVELYLVKAIV